MTSPVGGILEPDAPEGAWRDTGNARAGTSSPRWRGSRQRIFQPGVLSQGSQAVAAPLWMDQPGARPRWIYRTSYRHGRIFVPGLGQGTLRAAWPGLFDQPGPRPRWNPHFFRTVRSRRTDNAWYKVPAVNPAIVVPVLRHYSEHERLGAARKARLFSGRVFQPPLPPFANPSDWAVRRYTSRHLRYLLPVRSSMRRTFVPRWVVQAAPLFSGIASLTASAVVTELSGITVTLSASGTLAVQMYEFYMQAPAALDYRPADHTLVLNQGYDLAEQAECVLGRGSNVPAGSTNFGFVDTTYSLTKAQILTGANNSAF